MDYYTYTTNGDSLTLAVYMSSNSVVNVPDTINGLPVTGIGSFAFTNCANLTTIMVPASVTNIGYYPFIYCSNLTAITVDAQNPAYSSSLDGVMFNQNQTDLVVCPACKGGNYTIPDSVTNIEDGAFYYCWKLTAVCHFPQVGKHPATGHFYDCFNVTNVSIGDGVNNIGNYAFLSCSNLTGVIIPDSVTNIGVSVFSDCTGLAGVTLPAGINSLSSNLFYYCTSLAKISVGNNILNIGHGAFEYCGGLTNVALWKAALPILGTMRSTNAPI